jgi:hypothetical protein
VDIKATVTGTGGSHNAGMSWSIDTSGLPTWLTLGENSGTIADESTPATVALHINAAGVSASQSFTLAIKLGDQIARYVTIYLNVNP